MNKRFIPWLVPLLLLLCWEIACYYQLLPLAQAASPIQILKRFGQLLGEGELLRFSLVSLGRLLVSVVIGASSGIAIGIWIALSRPAQRLFGSMLQFVVGLPVVVWLPFAVMLFGTEEAFKIILASLSTFFLVYSHSFLATRSISQKYVEVAAMFEKNALEMIKHIIIPALMPTLFVTLRTALGLAWIILFFVEYASASQGTEGIGWFIADARAVGRIEDEFAGLLMLGLLAYSLDIVVAKLQGHATRWDHTLATNAV